MNQTMLSLSKEELEALIRRVVREELSYLLRVSASSLLEDLRQEGPDDSAEDDLLLQESLKILQEYRDKPGAWMKWEDLEKELDQAEAGDEWPEPRQGSPLDVPGIDLDITAAEIIQFVHAGRRYN